MTGWAKSPPAPKTTRLPNIVIIFTKIIPNTASKMSRIGILYPKVRATTYITPDVRTQKNANKTYAKMKYCAYAVATTCETTNQSHYYETNMIFKIVSIQTDSRKRITVKKQAQLSNIMGQKGQKKYLRYWRQTYHATKRWSRAIAEF